MADRCVVKRYNAGAAYGRRAWKWTYVVLGDKGNVIRVGDAFDTKRAVQAAVRKLGCSR